MNALTKPIAATALIAAVFAAHLHAQQVPTAPTATAVDAVMAKLTQAQKLELVGGGGMTTNAFAAAGLPALKMSDGPAGVRSYGPSDAYPAGIALAATWDPAMAQREGNSLANDAKARGVNVLLGPGVNIYRMPMNGRNFEYFGEDPYLSGRMAVGYIKGVQENGVAATVKHFDANNSEFDRHNTNALIDERTLHELYLPAFEAAVKDGHVAAVMDAYNLVNGQHMTQNAALNIDVLRKSWGFTGLVMSDWNATYDAVAAANGGLDIEMPKAKFMTPANLSAALAAGTVSQKTLDEKVRRIVTLALQYGSATTTPTTDAPHNTAASEATAYAVASEGIVLLKNDGKLLPLNRPGIHRIAVLGLGAESPMTGGGGSSHTVTDIAPNLIDSLKASLPAGVSVDFTQGIRDEKQIFSTTSFDGGLSQSQFASGDFTGVAKTSHVDHVDAWTPNPKLGGGAGARTSYRWTGTYTAPRAGEYLFVLGSHGGDAYTLELDGKTVLTQTSSEGSKPGSLTQHFTAGQRVNVQLSYVQKGAVLYAGLGIVANDDLVLKAATTAAAAADVAIVNVGFGPQYEAEGFDRTFELPLGQAALVQAVLAANPHTIVILNGGGGMDIAAWVDRVPALLHAWYSGEQGGPALADILCGKLNPSGKLPISLERKLSEDAAFASYYPRPGTVDVPYTEGIFLGYRHFDQSPNKPLFPFGFGLSYTTFSFHNLRIENHGGTDVHATFDISNDGPLAGDTIAELYISEDHAPVPRPVKELKAFQRVHLDPGQSQRIDLPLNARSFSYWDIATHDWTHTNGKFTVRVGDSSDRLPLSATVDLGKNP